LRSKFRILSGALVLAAMGFGPAAQAQALKVGVVDMQAALLKTKDGQKAADELKAKFGPKEDELNKRGQALAAKQDEYRKASAAMNDESKAAADRDIQAMTKNLQRDADDAKADFQSEEQRLLGGLLDKMHAILDKYGADNQFTLIVDTSVQPNNLVWASEATIITDKLVELYDKSSTPAPAPAAAKPPAARPPAAATSAPAPVRKTVPAPTPPAK
jgi:outer membrane protein